MRYETVPGSGDHCLASQAPSGCPSEEGQPFTQAGSTLLSMGSSRHFHAQNRPGKQALMTFHSQDMRGLRLRSTFSGVSLISFKQHHPYAAGGHGQKELGIWGEQAARVDTSHPSLRPACCCPGCPSRTLPPTPLVPELFQLSTKPSCSKMCQQVVSHYLGSIPSSSFCGFV